MSLQGTFRRIFAANRCTLRIDTFSSTDWSHGAVNTGSDDMQFKHILAASTAALSLSTGLVAPAFAQSTGSIDFDDKEIIVTGSRTVQNVGGISAPDTSKAKAVLMQENIQRQNPGQTILDTINQVPGVSFQNNDAYGSSGGTLSIRGFSSDRISLTFDGIPLNDSGNYAIYSNQQTDPGADRAGQRQPGHHRC